MGNLSERRPQLYEDYGAANAAQHCRDTRRHAWQASTYSLAISCYRMKENGADIECIRPYIMTSAKLAAVRGQWAYVLRLVAHGAVSGYFTGETSDILSEAELSHPTRLFFTTCLTCTASTSPRRRWPTCYARHMDAHRALWSSKPTTCWCPRFGKRFGPQYSACTKRSAWPTTYLVLCSSGWICLRRRGTLCARPIFVCWSKAQRLMLIKHQNHQKIALPALLYFRRANLLCQVEVSVLSTWATRVSASSSLSVIQSPPQSYTGR